MGRALTPQEQEEFNRKRREELEEISRKTGLSVEEHERIYQEALHGKFVPREKERAQTALEAALYKVGTLFLESLKTDNYREALDTVDDIDGMSDEDFSTLLAQRMSVLDEEERKGAERSIARRIEQWADGGDTPLSLREEILLDLQGIIRSHNYRAGTN